MNEVMIMEEPPFSDRRPMRSRNLISHEPNMADRLFNKMGIETSITGKPTYSDDRQRGKVGSVMASAVLLSVGGLYKTMRGGINYFKDSRNKKNYDIDYNMERPYPEEIAYVKQYRRADNEDYVDMFDGDVPNRHISTVKAKVAYKAKQTSDLIKDWAKESLNNMIEEDRKAELAEALAKREQIEREIDENTVDRNEINLDDLNRIEEMDRVIEEIEDEEGYISNGTGVKGFDFKRTARKFLSEKEDMSSDFITEDELINDVLTRYELGHPIELGVNYEIITNSNILLNFNRRSSRHINITELSDKYKQAKRFSGNEPTAQTIIGYSNKNSRYELAKITGTSNVFANVNITIIDPETNEIAFDKHQFKTGIIIIKAKAREEIRVKFQVTKF